jgi:hypothetical protein
MKMLGIILLASACIPAGLAKVFFSRASHEGDGGFGDAIFAFICVACAVVLVASGLLAYFAKG